MNDFLSPPPIDPLPPAPLLERFLFEQPLLPVVVLGLLAGIAVFAFARSGKRGRGLAVGLVLALCAAGIYAAAAMVTTTRETLLQRSEALIAATAGADTRALAGLLTDDARLNADGDIRRVVPPTDDVQDILGRVESTLNGRFRVLSWSIPDRQATVDGPNVGRTLLRVAVDVEGAGRTHYSWWQLHWAQGPEGTWRCFEIEPLWIQFVGSN
ncbi:MAG: hypothetical protein RIB58_12285 [Phycisphaerales bacterium]